MKAQSKREQSWVMTCHEEFVMFDNPSIGRSFRMTTSYREAILIRPITANFFGKLNVHWSRTQIPLSPCWATTVHKVKGITLSHAVVDIGPKIFTSGQSQQGQNRTKMYASTLALSEMSRLYARIRCTSNHTHSTPCHTLSQAKKNIHITHHLQIHDTHATPTSLHTFTFCN